MTKDDKDPLTDVDRRSIRILARSTKAAGPANARIAERLEKAAGTGDRGDYRRAGESFDSLPANERRRIGTHAERQAETEKQLVAARKQQPKVVKRAPSVDDTLDWKPLVMEHSPAADPTDGQAWKLGRPIEEAAAKPATAVPKPPVPKPSVPKPAGARPEPGAAAPGRPGAAAAAGRAKRPVIPAAVEPEDPDRSWDWQRIPEDPVLKSTRKKAAAADPIDELRRQMLGDDPKRR